MQGFRELVDKGDFQRTRIAALRRERNEFRGAEPAFRGPLRGFGGSLGPGLVVPRDASPRLVVQL